ncbi:MAG: DegV family protein [Lachnospiraceae bacterium]|nr:DegV family protein [Candidatus Colinaster scatohippi]
MTDYRIVTDTTADLPAEYIEGNKLGIMKLSYIFGDEEYSGETERELTEKEFYDRVRKGEMPTTAQVNPDQAKKVLEENLKYSSNILCISFSSGLSGTVGSVNIAANEIMEERDDVKIIVIDSLAASLGEGLLVHKAVVNKDNGMSFEDNAKWVEEHKLNMVHSFTVDDLFHLYRGGRVKRGAAIVGSLVNIKPILHVDNEGHLINLSTVRGRKKSLKELVNYMEAHMGSYADKNDIVFISHSDCVEDAQFVADEIKERFGINSFLINYIGPTIGSHTGCGTVALFFMGDAR